MVIYHGHEGNKQKKKMHKAYLTHLSQDKFLNDKRKKQKLFPIVLHVLKLLPTHNTSTCYWVILMNEMCSKKPLFQRFLIHLVRHL